MTRTWLRWGGHWVGRLYALYYRTLRVTGYMPDGSRITPAAYPLDSEILTLCERDVLALAGLTTHHRFTVLVAHGRDGDWTSAALEAIGCRVVRGASARGGAAALRGLTAALTNSSHPVAMVVDGPLGPRGRAKPGAIVAARHTGRPLRTLGAAARRRITFPGTWSGIYLPLPFTTLNVVCGDRWTVPQDADALSLNRGVERLTQQLAAARAQALALLDRRGAPAADGHVRALSPPRGGR